jgi:hypothetical protein
MSSENRGNTVVKRTPIRNKKPPDVLTLVAAVCEAGAQCQEVQSTPSTAAALAVLQAELTSAQGSLQNKTRLAQALLTAIKTLQLDLLDVKRALTSYEASVNALAKGDGVLIAKAGLQTRVTDAPHAALGTVNNVSFKLGKHPREAILSWPETPGATDYAVELNFTPEDATGPWTALTPTARHRRVVEGPTPGCQFLARVAAVAGDGTMSAWSPTILVTAR